MSRYKLLGEIWDNCQTKGIKLKQNVDLSKVIFYNTGKVNNKRVKINLSEMMNASEKSMSSIVKQLNKFRTVYVQLDYKPKINNEIVLSFFDKRLRQINYVLSNSLVRGTNIFFTS